jgi:hypothetical protein
MTFSFFFFSRFSLHAICISLVAVLAYVVKNSDLSEYKERLVAIR